MAILSDNVFGLKSLVRQAWACGHRRIAFIHDADRCAAETKALLDVYKRQVPAMSHSGSSLKPVPISRLPFLVRGWYWW